MIADIYNIAMEPQAGKTKLTTSGVLNVTIYSIYDYFMFKIYLMQ